MTDRSSLLRGSGNVQIGRGEAEVVASRSVGLSAVASSGRGEANGDATRCCRLQPRPCSNTKFFILIFRFSIFSPKSNFLYRFLTRKTYYDIKFFRSPFRFTTFSPAPNFCFFRFTKFFLAPNFLY